MSGKYTVLHDAQGLIEAELPLDRLTETLPATT